MNYQRPAHERGTANLGWLNSYHTFSFGDYYAPEHMGISALRVINDDTVDAGAGFGTHGHRDMEIISYVLEGSIEHEDSMGNKFVVLAGEVQRMSAGSGVVHSEYNHSDTDPLRFLQIWIEPDKLGIAPSYEQADIEQSASLTPLVTPNGQGSSLSINQDASIYRLRLNAGEKETFDANGRAAYFHVIAGNGAIENNTLVAGDGIGFTGSEIDSGMIEIIATADGLEGLWFDLPPTR